jgi:hypothetical protein
VCYKTRKECYFKCQNNIHKSEAKKISDYVSNKCVNLDCSVCNSLGYKFPNIFGIWSNKNKRSPYEYASKSRKEVWWKCPERKHKDYYRSIDSSNTCDFRCPECQYSKGENKISEYLLQLNIDYISQKEFDGLIGLGNGNLSYDFYLPQYNLLIEAQGVQHEKPVDFKGKGKKYAEQDLLKQQEHDRRKREYAKRNNIRLLEIWYWDFDNIEEILNRKFGNKIYYVGK